MFYKFPELRSHALQNPAKPDWYRGPERLYMQHT
jgi:hypothetical protein